MSQLCGYMRRTYEEGDHSHWLLGDSGYPLQPWLMTPISNPPPDSPEERYNSHHCRARNCVERCIGVWKAWFRCLRKDRTLHYSPERAGFMINACAVLHNMALHYRVPHPAIAADELVVDEENEAHLPMEGVPTRRRIVAQHFT
ncbi:hypothetical protein J437_LFUL011979 [Ladona fulva]|uniref:DDE Tnp4 domain-containing protein n=1 Tax=Ladona fulva TaxID=123851 RepID=A0A8K0KIU7_LADFU|nr:hypothetical protein J437_LFUL011979 [Ladona fulva]